MTATACNCDSTRPSAPLPLLSEEDGYIYHKFDAASRPDWAALEQLVGRAWGRDYTEKAVICFNNHYLDWLLQDDRWFGIQVTDRHGRLVGCEVALERQVVWNGRRLRGYYVTLLSVDPDHRGRGIAQRILRHLTEVALDERQADVLVSSFDAGAAGRPTVQKSVARVQGEIDLRISSPISMWACTADLREVDQYEPMIGLSRIALWPGLHWLLGFSPRPDEPGLTAHAASLDDVADPCSDFGFGLTGGPALMYRSRTDNRAGTLRFSFADRERVTISWHMVTLSKFGLPDRPLGMVQFVLPEAASGRNLVLALRHVNRFLLGQGCIATTILDTGMVSRGRLWQAGFRPTPRRIHFAVRGWSAKMAELGEFPRPLSVDLL
jgi:GNAT superfamily N-acetyltransferase